MKFEYEILASGLSLALQTHYMPLLHAKRATKRGRGRRTPAPARSTRPRREYINTAARRWRVIFNNQYLLGATPPPASPPPSIIPLSRSRPFPASSLSPKKRPSLFFKLCPIISNANNFGVQAGARASRRSLEELRFLQFGFYLRRGVASRHHVNARS